MHYPLHQGFALVAVIQINSDICLRSISSTATAAGQNDCLFFNNNPNTF